MYKKYLHNIIIILTSKSIFFSQNIPLHGLQKFANQFHMEV